MDQQQAISIARRYAAAVRSEMNPEQIVLFGSCAKGTASENSDIDIAVIFVGISGDFLEISARLWQLKRGIDYAIEPILLDQSEDKSGFIAEVITTGIVI